MKKTSLVLLSLILTAGCKATTVIFPLQIMTGQHINRQIVITPDLPTNALVNLTNLLGTTPITIHPANGVGTAELLSWSYTGRVDGWPGSFHFLVPDSTNMLNVVDLITNATAIGVPFSWPQGFTGTITNLSAPGWNDIKTTEIVSGAGVAAVDGSYILDLLPDGNHDANGYYDGKPVFADGNGNIIIWSASNGWTGWMIGNGSSLGGMYYGSLDNVDFPELVTNWVSVSFSFGPGYYQSSVNDPAPTVSSHVTTNFVQAVNVEAFTNGILSGYSSVITTNVYQ